MIFTSGVRSYDDKRLYTIFLLTLDKYDCSLLIQHRIIIIKLIPYDRCTETVYYVV